MGEMIKIDFAENLQSEKYNDSDMEEDESLRKGPTFSKRREAELYISPQREVSLRSEFNSVVVHDFGDEYHLTDEERIAKNKYYELFHIVNKATNKSKNILTYIVVVRNYLKLLNAIAENNGVYPPEKFKLMFLRKKIFIVGMKKFPVYKGRDRKNLNWNFVFDFILSGRDVSEFPLNVEKEVYTEDEIEEYGKRLFTEDEIKYIMEPRQDDQTPRLYFDIDEDSQDNTSLVVPIEKKQTKKTLKVFPEILQEIKEIKKNQSINGHLNAFIYDLSADDFTAIEKYDRKHGFAVSSHEVPEFKGEILSDKDYDRYMAELTEYEDTQIRENYSGKLLTREEYQQAELKRLLEDNNWNIRNLYDNKKREKVVKRNAKKEKERERKLKRKLAKMQDRRTIGDALMHKKKKKKKKVKKKNTNYKKEAIESMENIFMQTLDGASSFEDYDSYKESMTDWSWDNINK